MMGRLSHSAFRAEWEYCLEELEEAGVDMPSEDTLYRRYLRKITPELRASVLKQVFSLDDEGPPWKTLTWKEVADCVEFELETRADAKAATQEQAHTVSQAGGGGYLLTRGALQEALSSP